MDVGVAITKLLVMCKKSHVLSAFMHKCMAIIIFYPEIYSVQLLYVGPQVARYEKYAIVGTCHCTSNEQRHKNIRRAGPERDMIFHLRVTACRGQGSHRHEERLVWVASQGQGTSCCSSFISKILGAIYES